MQELIDVIRAAVSAEATNEQKAAGVRACRTIAAALDVEPGKPIALPGTPSASPPAARLSIDQVLDLAIARLTMIANEHDKNPAPALQRPSGLRIPVIPAAVPRTAARVVAKPASRAKAPARHETRKQP